MGNQGRHSSTEPNEEGVYECEACGETFETEAELLDHLCDAGQVG